LPPHLNTATCRACETARLLRLPLERLQRDIRHVASLHDNLKSWLRLQALLGYLRQGTFLGFQSAPSVLPLLDHCPPTAFPPTHAIQAHGLSDEQWFFIRSGAVVLDAESPEAGQAPEMLGPGDCFGEQALLSSGRLRTAVAWEDTVCLSLTRDELFQH